MQSQFVMSAGVQDYLKFSQNRTELEQFHGFMNEFHESEIDSQIKGHHPLKVKGNICHVFAHVLPYISQLGSYFCCRRFYITFTLVIHDSLWLEHWNIDDTSKCKT